MRHAFPMNLIIPEGTAPVRRAREHLTEHLRAALLSGNVAAGDPLPSSRVLANAVGVSRGTVVAVYEDLAGEGYLVIVPGSGTYVAQGLAVSAVSPSTAARSPGESRAATSALPAKALAKATVNLSPGSPATNFSKNRDWVAAWRSAVKQDLPGLPPAASGDEQLRELIAHHLRTARGVVCAPADIIVTAGTSDGLALILQAQRSQGQEQARIATEDPGYRAAREVISACGGTPVPIPVRDGGMDPEALRRTPGKFSAALLTPSHQYPLGGRLPVAARLDFLAWAKELGAIILEDDYDSEFRHGAPLLPAIASLDHEERVVLIGSYSKTLTPWLRCGYLVISDPELRSRALRLREAIGQPVSGLVQSALAEFMRSGGLQRHLVRVGREYAHRRKLVITVAEALGPHCSLEAVEGGLHAAITWAGSPHADEAVALLAERGVELASLSKYYHDGSRALRNGIVFGYGAPTDLQLRHALDEIITVLGEPLRSKGASGLTGLDDPVRASACT